MEATVHKNTQKIVYESVIESFIYNLERKKETGVLLTEDRYYPKNHESKLHDMAKKKAIKDISEAFNSFLQERL